MKTVQQAASEIIKKADELTETVPWADTPLLKEIRKLASEIKAAIQRREGRVIILVDMGTVQEVANLLPGQTAEVIDSDVNPGEPGVVKHPLRSLMHCVRYEPHLHPNIINKAYVKKQEEQDSGDAEEQ